MKKTDIDILVREGGQSVAEELKLTASALMPGGDPNEVAEKLKKYLASGADKTRIVSTSPPSEIRSVIENALQELVNNGSLDPVFKAHLLDPSRFEIVQRNLPYNVQELIGNRFYCVTNPRAKGSIRVRIGRQPRARSRGSVSFAVKSIFRTVSRIHLC
jgi:hypothetical protein